MKRTQCDSNAPFQTIKVTSKKTGISMYSIRKGIKSGTIPYICRDRTYLVNVPLFVERLNVESVEQMGA